MNVGTLVKRAALCGALVAALALALALCPDAPRSPRFDPPGGLRERVGDRVRVFLGDPATCRPLEMEVVTVMPDGLVLRADSGGLLRIRVEPGPPGVATPTRRQFIPVVLPWGTVMLFLS